MNYGLKFRYRKFLLFSRTILAYYILLNNFVLMVYNLAVDLFVLGNTRMELKTKGWVCLQMICSSGFSLDLQEPGAHGFTTPIN